MDKKLMAIQSELKAPKGQRNSFGNYNYRSCEDIVEAVKPLLKKHDCTLTLSDEVFIALDRVYIKATATFTGDSVLEVTALAREPLDKKGMDSSQITGTASSYARKYALNGLFLIDDTKDADTDSYHKTTNKPAKETAKPKKVETNERAKLIEYLTLTGIEMGDVAKTYKLNANTTQERFKEVLEDLINGK